MIKMFKMLDKKIKWQFAFGCFLTLIFTILSIFLPLVVVLYIRLILSDSSEPFSVTLIKGLIEFGEVEYSLAFNWLTTVVLLQTLLTAILAFASTIVIVWAAEQSSYFYRTILFKKYQELSLKNIADLKSESLITRLSNDIAIFWEFLVNGATIMIKSLFLIVGGLVITAIIDWRMALSIFGIIPFVVILGLVITLKVNPLLKRAQKTVENVTKIVDENISGIRVIKTFNLEEKRFNVLKEANGQWFKNQYRIGMIFSTAFPLFSTFVNLLIIGIYSVVGRNVVLSKVDKLTITNITLFLDYLWIVAGGILLFLAFLSSFIRARVSVGRILEVYEFKNDGLYLSEGLKVKTYDMKIDNLSFKYYDSSPSNVINNISLTIPFKKTIGIIGPTGSGKSTFVNLLVNNFKYYDGSIKLGGLEVNELNSKHLHDIVGIVYQDSLLYTGNIRDNMLWAKEDATDKEIELALKNACALDFVNEFSNKLHHPVYQGGKNLSGGQKQRLSIARTLLRKPKILILDDSTSALDNITAQKILTNIKENYECSTIIVSQKISAIKDANEIIVFSPSGHIIGIGTHDQLKENCSFYRRIYQTQLDQ
ncbi:ABC transporter ATP-binding protein [Mycoplasma tauri]|uniref:ABC transporter ATP-binding protein n=1 Tax=Mycoplasma tauri TaxID=547987 RepID=UPI0019671D95|nr:ABC transporter ATP-binding protein [Mycoplasma tauri]QSB07401.1 ABC transporter ATP-binding protein [Mycoplasma tauri]